MKKRNKKRQYRYINGAKGAISLFMAVLMTPFLSIALLLVETGRYNSMVSLLDEIMNVAAVSTLSSYDDYLQERWGLLAISQGIDIDSTFNTYMETNKSVMGSKVVLNETTAKGIYPLSDTDILKNQIMEYSKLNIPTKLAFEIGDLSKLVSNLEKKINGFSQFMNTMASGVKVVDAGVTISQEIDKLEEISQNLENNQKEYDGKYNSFANNVNTLIDNMIRKKNLEADIAALESQKETLESQKETLNGELTDLEQEASNSEEVSEAQEEAIEEKKEEIQDKNEEISGVQSTINQKNRELTEVNRNITNGYSSAETAQTEYAQWLQGVIDNLEDFKESMKACGDAVDGAVKNTADLVKNATELKKELEKKRSGISEKEDELKKTKKKMEEMKNDPKYDPDSEEYRELMLQAQNQEYNLQLLKDEILDEELKVAEATAASEAIGAMQETFKSGKEKYDEATIDKAIAALKEQKSKVNSLYIRGLTYASPKITAQEYKYAKIEGFLSVKALGDMADYLLEQTKDSTFGAIKDLIESVYDSIMGVSVFVDSNLSAVIDTGYYDTNLGGLPGADASEDGVMAIFRELGNVIKGAVKLAVSPHRYPLRPWKGIAEWMKALWETAVALYNLVVEIVSFLIDIVANLASLLMGYERLYLTSYCAYNLSCRTDYSKSLEHTSFTNISGYSAGEDSFPTASGIHIPVFSEIYVMLDSLVQSMGKTGKDLTFYGAELEYVLFGSKSEVANQLYIFVVLYLIRLLLSFTSVQTNAEIMALAASSTIGYPVVMALFTFLEPLAQTIMLVNGKSQSIMPTTVYLSPSGLPSLLSDLITICKLDSNQQEKLKSKMIAVCDGDEGKFQKNLDYVTSSKEYSDPKKAKSYFDFSYRDHCYIWLLLSVRNEAMMARLMDIIQMETMYYYTQTKAGYTFDLRNSFTYLDTFANLEINQLMPSLLDSGLFTVKRQQYRGY